MEFKYIRVFACKKADNFSQVRGLLGGLIESGIRCDLLDTREGYERAYFFPGKDGGRTKDMKVVKGVESIQSELEGALK